MWWPNRISSGRLGRFNFYVRWEFVTRAWSRILILGPVKDFCRPMLFPHSRIYTPWSWENTVLWRNSNKNSCRIFLFFLQYCWIFYARPAFRTLLISTQWDCILHGKSPREGGRCPEKKENITLTVVTFQLWYFINQVFFGYQFKYQLC